MESNTMEKYTNKCRSEVFCTYFFRNSMDCQNLWCCGSISQKNFLILPKNFLNFWFDTIEYQSIYKSSQMNTYYQNIAKRLTHLCFCNNPTPLSWAGGDTRPILSGVWQVWIQSFLSPRLVAIPITNWTICPIIYHSWMENNWMHIFPKGICAMLKFEEPRPNLVLASSFPTTITITPRTPHHTMFAWM